MTLVTLLGGARSGKSRLAVELATATGAPVTYLATGEARDDEMTVRIEAPRRTRPAGWATVEEPLALEQTVAALPAAHVAIVDCLSLWLANVIERGDAEDEIVASAARAAAAAAARLALVIGVSNEVGLGIVNRTWVATSAEAAFVVAGRPVPLLQGDDFVARVTGTSGGA